MTNFVSVNLADLPAPDAIETIAYEALLQSYKDKVTALNPSLASALSTEFSPLSALLQAESYGDMILRARVNAAVRAVLIAFSTGSDLDQICATFYGVPRLVVTPAVMSTDPTPVVLTPAVMEDDDTFRARALLSIEARSVAGPEGAYDYHALTPNADVLDVATYGEEDGALYADGSAVTAPEVLVVILGRDGDGTPSDTMVSNVYASISAEDVRPIGDKLTVEKAQIFPYTVEGVIQVRPGADPQPLIALATQKVQAYCDATRRINRVVQQLEIGAAMQVSSDIRGLKLISPPADIDPGSKGATYCSRITISAEVLKDSWR